MARISTQTQISVLAILAALSLQACNYNVAKTDAASSVPNTPFNIVSKANFDSTVRPLLLNHCASCHSTSTRPLHSSSSLDVAYGDIISYSLVDLDNVNRSRLYNRLAIDQHNCWNGSCSASAGEMLSALQAWKTANAAAPYPDDPSRITVPPTVAPATMTSTPVDLSLAANATEMSFTILNHARGPVVFSFKIEKFDATNYRIFWPTIVAPSGAKVTLKDLKFKVNGNLRADAAFSYLFREVNGQGATVPVILDSSITLILTLQNGPGADAIAPSFGMFVAP